MLQQGKVELQLVLATRHDASYAQMQQTLTSPHLALIFSDKMLSALVSPMLTAAIEAFASWASLNSHSSSNGYSFGFERFNRERRKY